MYADLADYLYQEAHEKAFELEIEARKEYQSKVSRIFNEKRKSLESRMEGQDKALATAYRQEYSRLRTSQKANHLQSRSKALVKLLNKAQLTLFKLCRSDTQFYKQLLVKLILEVGSSVLDNDDGVFSCCLLLAA